MHERNWDQIQTEIKGLLSRKGIIGSDAEDIQQQCIVSILEAPGTIGTESVLRDVIKQHFSDYWTERYFVRENDTFKNEERTDNAGDGYFDHRLARDGICNRHAYDQPNESKGSEELKNDFLFFLDNLRLDEGTKIWTIETLKQSQA